MKRLWSAALGLVLLLTSACTHPVRAEQAKPAQPMGMFALYEQNREQGIPNYITEDFLLLTYGMLLEEAVTEMEETVLAPRLAALVERLGGAMESGKDAVEIREANRDFLSVIGTLLAGGEQPLDAANPEAVAGELKRVRAGQGIAKSPLMGQKLDYSQFRPRGKYTRSPALSRYFQAMRYAGAVLFPVKASEATGIDPAGADRLTRQAVLLVQAIGENPETAEIYEKLTDDLNWIFGPADDMTLADYQAVLETSGDAETPELREALFQFAVDNNRQPVILGGAVTVSALEAGVTAADVLTGFRLLPSRFTPSAAAFQALVYPSVGEFVGKKGEAEFTRILLEGKVVKGFPTALEMMALLGSEPAAKRLAETGNRKYKNYEDAAGRAAAALRTPGAGLAGDHIRTMRYWLKPRQNSEFSPDAERRLNSCFGLWTYSRYINLLYAKQSTTGQGKGFQIPAEEGRQTAWIAPVPDLYNFLQWHARSLRDHLGADAANSGVKSRLERWLTVLDRCVDISLAEIGEEPMSSEDAAFLNGLDKTLLELTGKKDAPIIVDVHTEPNTGKVVEVALGAPRVEIREITDGQKARGGFFRFYEFQQPMDNRLTVEQWRDMLTLSNPLEGLTISPASTEK